MKKKQKPVLTAKQRVIEMGRTSVEEPDLKAGFAEKARLPEKAAQAEVSRLPEKANGEKEPPMEVITLRLPVGMVRCLKKRREETGEEVTAMLRPLIAKFLEKCEHDNFGWFSTKRIVSWEKQVERFDSLEEVKQVG